MSSANKPHKSLSQRFLYIAKQTFPADGYDPVYFTYDKQTLKTKKDEYIAPTDQIRIELENRYLLHPATIVGSFLGLPTHRLETHEHHYPKLAEQLAAKNVELEAEQLSPEEKSKRLAEFKDQLLKPYVGQSFRNMGMNYLGLQDHTTLGRMIFNTIKAPFAFAWYTILLVPKLALNILKLVGEGLPLSLSHLCRAGANHLTKTVLDENLPRRTRDLASLGRGFLRLASGAAKILHFGVRAVVDPATNARAALKLDNKVGSTPLFFLASIVITAVVYGFIFPYVAVATLPYVAPHLSMPMLQFVFDVTSRITFTGVGAVIGAGVTLGGMLAHSATSAFSKLWHNTAKKSHHPHVAKHKDQPQPPKLNKVPSTNKLLLSVPPPALKEEQPDLSAEASAPISAQAAAMPPLPPSNPGSSIDSRLSESILPSPQPSETITTLKNDCESKSLPLMDQITAKVAELNKMVADDALLPTRLLPPKLHNHWEATQRLLSSAKYDTSLSISFFFTDYNRATVANLGMQGNAEANKPDFLVKFDECKKLIQQYQNLDIDQDKIAILERDKGAPSSINLRKAS